MAFDSPTWMSRLKNAWYGDLLHAVGTVQHTTGNARKPVTHLVEVAVSVPIRDGRRRVHLRVSRSCRKQLAERNVKLDPREAKALADLLRAAASRCHRPTNL